MMRLAWLAALPLFVLGAANGPAARCTAVADASHLEVTTGTRTERVVLIGVATDQAGECADQGRAYTRAMLLDKPVRVVADRQARDAAGTMLAYVYLEDGTFVNERLIANGYARLGSLGDNTAHAGELVAAQASARTKHLCVWTGERPQRRDARERASGPVLRMPLGGGGGGGADPLKFLPNWREPLPR